MKPCSNPPKDFLHQQSSSSQKIKTPAVLLALFLALCTSNAASVLDSFNTVSGPSAVDGSRLGLFNLTTAGGIGFTTGYEYAAGGVPILRTNDLSVTLANYVSGQPGPLNHFSVAAAIGTTARRVATRSTTPVNVSANGAIWFSFVASLLNANGDVALTFNGTQSSGSTTAGAGMRVGLGQPTLPGALGVGPLASQATLASITDGVNGAITANGFVPTDGTPGLVLGKISTDPGTGYPKVELWYNPDVANQASLPAPTLSFIDSSSAIVPATITRLGYQVVRAATQNEVIDNAKVSDEPNAFDIVYKNAPLPLPAISVAATVPTVTEGQPTNIVFSITSDRPLSSALTVLYTTSGVATNGFDGVGFTGADFADTNFNTGTLAGSVTIPAGETNVIVSISVIDDAVAEGDESLILNLGAGSEYIVGSGSAAATILDNNDATVSVQYMFTRTSFPQVWDTNLTASAVSSAAVGGAYSTTAGYFVSPDASLRARGDITPATAADALADGSFMSFSVSPLPGRALTLTNLQLQAMYANYLFQEPAAAAAVIFVRSSLDNFATDLVSWVLQPDNIVWENPWYTLNLTLGSTFTNLAGGVEFRLFIYDDSAQNQVGVRIDNLYVSGETFAAVGAQQVTISATVPEGAEPATPATLTITRFGETTNALTVFYSVSGTASNGADYVFLPGSASIPVGESNGVVTVTPIDDELVESSETVVLNLIVNTNYAIVSAFSGTVNIADDGDLGGLVGYLFNEGNNAAGSLSAVAMGSTKQPDKVAAANAAAGPGLGALGANNTAGVGHGYATSLPHSGLSSLFIRSDYLAPSAVEALATGDYVSIAVAPKPGFALTLTNFSAYVKLVSGVSNAAFLRSSLDNFASDLGSLTVPGGVNEDPYLFWSVPLTVTETLVPVEFRMFFHTVQPNADILRVDDVALQGAAIAVATAPVITSITVAGSSVTINFTGAATDPASAFKLYSAGVVDGLYGEDTSASITGTGGSYQAATAINGAARFYKVRR